MTISLDVSFITKNDDFAQAKSSLESNVTKAKGAASMNTISISDSEQLLLNTVDETPTIGVCVDGSVYGLNQGLVNGTDHSQKCRKSSNACFASCWL